MESVSKTPDANLKGKWQWASNSDPWSKAEEILWEFYSPKDNYMIEKAYDDKEAEVDLGEYIVSMKHMIQKKKGMIILQRPIRRITDKDETDARSERYFETELPKTINKIFGSLDHFISFFSRRNPEILSFTEQFQEFERLDDLDGLKKEILPKLIDCLEEELLKPIEDQLKDHSLTAFQKKIWQKTKGRHDELISLLKKDFASFEEFYGLILKSYTMETSLYLNLNKYLRNESWTDLDKLLPYSICLCKAFFSFKLSNNNQKDNKLPVTENSIILYRGTALDEFALEHYQAEKVSKLFSWYSVTSTSRNREMAEKFMYKSADVKNKKYPVLFIIEIPLGIEARDSEYLKWIDIHQYSAIPNEDEVILAPGTAFEVEQISTDQDKTTIIKMKLKHEVESLAHGGLIMQGAFQNEMMIGKQVKIMCLEGKELYETLKSTLGNRLIEEIEFILCIFDQRSLGEMLLILPTLEKAKGLKLICCKYVDRQEISSTRLQSIKDCKIEEIEISEVQDIFKILKDDDFWGSLKTLNIDFRKIVFDDYIFQVFKFPTRLISLVLDFSNCHDITNNGIIDLASQGLKYLTQLTSLNLNFSYCEQITDKEVSILALHALKYLTQLTSLTLNFSHCPQITNEGVRNLALDALRHLTQLTSLTLDFSSFRELTDQGVNNVAVDALKYLTRLTSLTLNFFYCRRITDDGLTGLAFHALRYLTQLTSLALDFSHCRKITNEGVSNLASQGLKYLTKLTSLALDFYSHQITDDGVSNLASQGFKYLTQLTSLTLSFSHYREITDERINNLVFHGLEPLSQLTFFSFNRRVIKQTCQHHQRFEDEGITNPSSFLNFTRPKNQNRLRSLMDDLSRSTRSLENNNFERLALISKETEKAKRALKKFLLELMDCQCVKMAPSSTLDILSFDEVVSIERNLDEKAIDLPISLQVFFKISSGFLPGETDYLPQSEQIKDDGVSNLASQGLKYLTQLTSLTMDFSSCREITDQGVNNLALHALKYLTQLTSLTLNFSHCHGITDDGMTSLALYALKYLTQLTSLTLDFSYCEQITDEGVKNLAFNALKYLTQLTSLALKFSECSKITDQGVSNLALHALKYLTQLTSLTLSFSPYGTTDEGVTDLASQGLKYLIRLISLTLDFSFCDQITNDGVTNLAFQGLKYLTQLTSLNLNFSFCEEITDEGMNNLIYQTIKHSTQLTTLALAFSDSRMTQFTTRSIGKLLHYCGFVDSQTQEDYKVSKS